MSFVQQKTLVYIILIAVMAAVFNNFGSFSKQTDFGNKFLRCIYAFDHALFDVFSDGGLWNQ